MCPIEVNTDESTDIKVYMYILSATIHHLPCETRCVLCS